MALVDEVRRRLDASYEEALAGLEEADGELLHALAAIERRRRERQDALQGGELIGRALALAKEGKVAGLQVRLGDRVVRRLSLPKSTAGAVVGAVLASIVSHLDIDLVAQEPTAEPAEQSGEVSQ